MAVSEASSRAAGQSVDRPAAIVLCKVATGLAVVRSLARHGIDVHAVLFDPEDPLHYSRYGHKVKYHEHVARMVKSGKVDSADTLVDFLVDYALKLGGHPVVIPTCDANALLLAKHADRLSQVCRIWTTPYAHLSDIVHKDALYDIAVKNGVPLLPSIAGLDYEGIAAWTLEHPGPYLLKPTYHMVKTSNLGTKNKVVPTRDELLQHVRQYGVASVVIQLFRWGGDGEIYDAYGLCNKDGQVVTMASHRRIRQCAPNLGATSYGEIPGFLPEGDERLFEVTRQLLGVLRFHGVFGIEWLRDRETGQLYLIDFNARPFLSIGHLLDCGLNLSFLAYRDLIGDELSDVEPQPKLQHRYWVDLLRDVRAFRSHASNRPTALAWLLSLMKVSSHAYWSWRDPGPTLSRLRDTSRLVVGVLRKIGKPQAVLRS